MEAIGLTRTRHSARIVHTLVLVALMSGAGPCFAQGRHDGLVASGSERLDVNQTRPAPLAQRPQTFDWRAYLLFDSTTMAASRTFDAIFGTHRLQATGFGGEILHIWKGLFGRVAFSSLERQGERVVVDGDEAVAVGIPLRLTLRPLELGGGWRLPPVAAGRVVPYAGGSMLRLAYIESSDFADDAENSDETFVGMNVFGGIEARVAPWIVAGAEVQYRHVANALGTSGASQAFGESNLGGATVRVLVGIRR